MHSVLMQQLLLVVFTVSLKHLLLSESTATPISIADLVTKMTSTPTAVDENYVITAHMVHYT